MERVTVDGIIFADLSIGGSGSWGGETYTIEALTGVTFKQYEIGESYEGSYGTKPVLKATSDGEDRFYVMGLENITQNKNTNKITGGFTWYDRAYRAISDYSTVTSTAFGTGKTNTHNMITKWNDSYYGAQDGSASNYLDLWGVIQDKVYGNEEKKLENVKWFVPSKDEWCAFGACLKSIGMSSMGGRFWSSSLLNDFKAYYVEHNSQMSELIMNNGSPSMNGRGYPARLAATY